MKVQLKITSKAGVLRVDYPSGRDAKRVQRTLTHFGIKSEIKRAVK